MWPLSTDSYQLSLPGTRYQDRKPSCTVPDRGLASVERLTMMEHWAGGRRNDGWIPDHGREEPGTDREAAPQAEANRLHQPQQAF
jgi:hypothetical protein